MKGEEVSTGCRTELQAGVSCARMTKRPNSFTLAGKPVPTPTGHEPPAVTIRYVCPLCGGPHAKAECPTAREPERRP
jgi:hypothetical protein